MWLCVLYIWDRMGNNNFMVINRLKYLWYFNPFHLLQIAIFGGWSLVVSNRLSGLNIFSVLLYWKLTSANDKQTRDQNRLNFWGMQHSSFSKSTLLPNSFSVCHLNITCRLYSVKNINQDISWINQHAREKKIIEKTYVCYKGIFAIAYKNTISFMI